MVVFLWWCFCGGVCVVVFLWWCFSCDGVVVFVWWWCGGVFVVVWWSFCGGVFVVVFLWWCFCGGVFVVSIMKCFVVLEYGVVLESYFVVQGSIGVVFCSTE